MPLANEWREAARASADRARAARRLCVQVRRAEKCAGRAATAGPPGRCRLRLGDRVLAWRPEAPVGGDEIGSAADLTEYTTDGGAAGR
jgi:hypothetical protein